MKDLTHYFQSPVKIISSTPTLQEECVVVDAKSTVSKIEIVKNKKSNNSPLEKNEVELSKKSENDLISHKTKKCLNSKRSCNNSVSNTSNNAKKQVEGNVMLENKEKNGCSDVPTDKSKSEFMMEGTGNAKNSEEICKADEHNISDAKQSPNAFQILMSTQQVFSSTNSGKKESVDEVPEDIFMKQENKKKVKENLEKMAKRKHELEIVSDTPEDPVEKATKKRRRIIVESDSEDENIFADASSKTLLNESGHKSSGKRKKPSLQVSVTKKHKKNVSLQNNNGESVMEDRHPTSQKRNGKEKNPKYEGKGMKEIKEVTLEVCNEDNISKCLEVVVEKGKGNSGNELVNIENKGDTIVEIIPSVLECSSSVPTEVVVNSDSCISEPKKKGNLLNYFSKVSGEGRRQHSEKIQVTADVHFPITSAGKVSKKNTTKRKSKRRGDDCKVDDIQLLDSEIIEKPAPVPKEVREDTHVKQNTVENNTLCTKTPSSCKARKMKIRLPESSSEERLPLKQNKKQGPFVKRKKLRFSSDLCRNEIVVDNTLKSNLPRKRSSKTAINQNTPQKMPQGTVKSTLRKNTNIKTKSTPKTEGISEKEEIVVKSEVDSVNESECTMKDVTPRTRKKTKKKSLSVNKDIIASTDSDSSVVCDSTLTKKSVKQDNRFSKKNSNPLVESVTDEKQISRKDSRSRQPQVKKELISSKKVSIRNKATSVKKEELFTKPVQVKKAALSPKNTSKNTKTEKNVSAVTHSCPIEDTAEKEDTSSIAIVNKPGKQTVIPIDNVCSTVGLKELSVKKNRGKRKDTVAKAIAEEISEEVQTRSTFRSELRRSCTKLSFTKPEFSDFEDDSLVDTDEDAFATDDTEDYVGDYCDYGEDSEGEDIEVEDIEVEDIESEDSDEPIIDVKKKKKPVTSTKINLDQKLVLQFLKEARGTLSRKLSSNDAAKVSSNDSKETETETVQIKLAPVFASKRTKCPDKKTLLARKTFLHSGVPEEVKKMVEIQKLAEEQEHIIFPSVSHVQQKEDCVSVWNLPDIEMKFSQRSEELNTHVKIPMGVFTKCDSEMSGYTAYTATRPLKMKYFRDFLRAVKSETPEFPVYRTFRNLLDQNHTKKPEASKGSSTKRGRRRSSLASKKEQETCAEIPENGEAAWITKYRASSSSDILGNINSVKRLKKWLELWIQVKENTFHRHFNDDQDSAEEFINATSDDEHGRMSLPKNTAILMGPVGSGKTMTVYALAHELGYKVLEVNASARRTGRRILSELMEATQSHQVAGKGSEMTPGIKGFFTSKEKSESKKSLKKKQSEQQKKKLSLILVEDVDIVFEEQDDGFVTALNTLVASSKRPVVLITSDPSCPHLFRFLEKSLVLEFKPAPCKHIGVWLQLVCLIEGVRVRRTCVEELLRYNKGDIRKTLLQLQFWVLSGGENQIAAITSSDPPDYPDDVSNSSWVSIDDKKTENQISYPFNSHCLGAFMEVDPQMLPVDAGKLWWNMPYLMGLSHVSPVGLQSKEVPDGSELRENTANVGNVIHKKDAGDEKMLSECPDSEEAKKIWKSVCSSEDMNVAVQLADVLSVVDGFSHISDRTVCEPDFSAWEKDPADSLSLNEDMRTCRYGVEHTAQCIARWLVSSGINQCTAQLCPERLASQLAVLQRQPLEQTLSWREEQHRVQRELENAVAMLCWPQRRAVTMDYISCLRNISRSEQDKECINEKRNNRFFHYLKGLGVNLSPASLHSACNAFKLHINS